MHAAVRPYLTAGVALVGASVIAVSPVTPVPDVVRTSHEAVSLAAISNPTDPFVAYPEAVTNTFTNIGLLAGALLENPAPILQSFVEAQLSYGAASWDATVDTGAGLVAVVAALPVVFQTAATQFLQGQVGPAILTLVSPFSALVEAFTPLVTLAGSVISNVVQNIANVVEVLTSPAAFTAIVTGLAAPVNSVIAAFAQQTQLTIEALATGDLVKAVGAVVSAPAVLTDALINGFDPVNENLRGIINGTVVSFLVLRNAIAEAIDPLPAPVAKASAVPDQSAPVVELQIASTDDQNAPLPADDDGITDGDEAALSAGDTAIEPAGEIEDGSGGVDGLVADDADVSTPADTSTTDGDDILTGDEEVTDSDDPTVGGPETSADDGATPDESGSTAPDPGADSSAGEDGGAESDDE